MRSSLFYLLDKWCYRRVCVCVCACVRTHAKSLSHIWLFATPWTIAHQAPFSVHGILQAIIPDQGAIPFSRGSCGFRDWQADSLPLVPPGKPQASVYLVLAIHLLPIQSLFVLNLWPLEIGKRMNTKNIYSFNKMEESNHVTL